MSPVRHLVSYRSGIAVALLLCAMPFMLVAGVCAADEYYTGYLGDIIDLHGYSYGGGGQVYLFMTGPGLPVNGVTLTDVSQRADQGHFTIVDLDSSQQWSMKWDTSRIWNDIDPGTYLVYVTTQPVDYANLGGSSTYQTLSVYFMDSGASTGSSSSSYTLHPEEHVSTTSETTATVQSAVITTPTVLSTPVPDPTTRAPALSTTAAAKTTTRRAPLLPATAVIAVLGCTGILLYRVSRR